MGRVCRLWSQRRIGKYKILPSKLRISRKPNLQLIFLEWYTLYFETQKMVIVPWTNSYIPFCLWKKLWWIFWYTLVHHNSNIVIDHQSTIFWNTPKVKISLELSHERCSNIWIPIVQLKAYRQFINIRIDK